MPEDGVCCACGEDGDQPAVCTSRTDAIHCMHWTEVQEGLADPEECFWSGRDSHPGQACSEFTCGGCDPCVCPDGTGHRTTRKSLEDLA